MKNILLAAFLALAALPVEAQDIDLRCSGKPGKGRSKIRLEGTAPLPDASVLRITLYRLQEQSSEGRISPLAQVSRTALVAVEQKKFSTSSTVEGAGTYRALVELLDDDQTEDVLVKIKATRREWEFTFDAWDDSFIPDLPKRLLELDGLSKDTIEMIRRFEVVSTSTDAWKKDSTQLLKDAQALLKKVQNADMRRAYTAAGSDLTYILRNLIAAADLLRWNTEGGFDGVWDYHSNTKQKTFKQEEFSFGALRKYADETLDVGGREMVIWILKEIRRILALADRGAASAALRGIIKECDRHPGFALYAAALEGYAVEIERGVAADRVTKIREELASLEKQARGEKEGDKP